MSLKASRSSCSARSTVATWGGDEERNVHYNWCFHVWRQTNRNTNNSTVDQREPGDKRQPRLSSWVQFHRIRNWASLRFGVKFWKVKFSSFPHRTCGAQPENTKVWVSSSARALFSAVSVCLCPTQGKSWLPRSSSVKGWRLLCSWKTFRPSEMLFFLLVFLVLQLLPPRRLRSPLQCQGDTLARTDRCEWTLTPQRWWKEALFQKKN